MSYVFSRGDVPANPLEKPGYRLEFHDEFEAPDLDGAKWLACYLPQWSSRARSAPRYALRDGTLVLQIAAGQAPWCPEFDGGNRCSSLQTGVFSGPLGSPIGQHRFHPACVVREPQANTRTYTPQYGYFELRAKASADPATMVALWMIGYEDAPERSAEIAIMEIKGAGVSPEGARVGYGVHPWSDPAIADTFFEDVLAIDPTCFHIYAAEWKPDGIDFYVDNHKIRTIGQSPRYPMQFMLGIYEFPSPANHAGSPALYPKEFVVDYFRAYQRTSMTNTPSSSVQRVREALAAQGLTDRVVELPVHARTAQQAADALGCAVAQIAKSLVFRTAESGRAVLVIASGANRVDEARVGELVGEPIAKADAAFVRAHTGFAIGGVAPLGHPAPLLTLLDEDLLGYDTIWAAAGAPQAVFRLVPEELRRITGGQAAALAARPAGGAA
ncbi:MAG TPA: YbaK/EbsC family protein [Roseiflexaceae bacterium]|nr:YbaK/EbsC family protein [Roseiflexaceae bacterium]